MIPKPLLKVIILLCLFYSGFAIANGSYISDSSKGYNSNTSVIGTNFFVDKELGDKNTLISLPVFSEDNSFHLFTHGRPGELLINGEWKNAVEIADFMNAQIKGSAIKLANLNIYGCEFGKGKVGQNAVIYLRNALGVNISASDDITGKDGDWDLEIGAPVSIKGMGSYAYNLQCGPLTIGSADLDGDGTPDINDLDDDGDGISDIDEGGLVMSTDTVLNGDFLNANNWTGNTGNGNTGWAITGGFAQNSHNGLTSEVVDNLSQNIKLRSGITPAQPATFTMKLANRNTGFPSAGVTQVNSWSQLWVYAGSGNPATHRLFRMNNAAGTGTSQATINDINPTVVQSLAIDGNPLARNIAISNTTQPVRVVSLVLNTTTLPIVGPIYFQHRAGADDNYVDDVSYTYMEGIDTDGDGIPNYQDLDSDNDGIPDYIETNSDTDGDGIPNHVDLDSDGDGCSDADEAGTSGFTVNYSSFIVSAATPDGLTSAGCFVPSNNNWINPLDTSACPDSDGDEIADKIDIDDDNDGVLDTIEQNCPIEDYNTNAASGINNIFSRYNIGFPTILYDQLADDIGLIFSISQAFATGISFSNACGEPALFGNGFDSDIWIKSVNPSNISQPVPLYSITLKNDCASFNNEFLTYSAYDINGGFLYTYNIPATQTSNTKFDLVMDPLYNVYSIKITRTQNAAVIAGVALKSGNGFFMCDSNRDTDGDGVPNHLDLDSDGDGCPDAVEAGTAAKAGLGNTSLGTLVNIEGSQTDVPNAIVGNNSPAEYGANGFYTGIESNDTQTASYTGIYTYDYAINSNVNLCKDSDDDGIVDFTDLDDDNDGVLDAVESPSCFYTLLEASKIFKITTSKPLAVAPGDPQPGVDIPSLHNGSITDANPFNFAGHPGVPPGTVIFTIEYPTPVILNSLTIRQTAFAITSTGFGRLYGSINGTDYTVLPATTGTSLGTATVTMNTTNTLEYKYYQIRFIGTAATGNTANSNIRTDNIQEISVVLATNPTYNPSAHPKLSNCSEDFDGDGFLNHLDTDSDNDGCSDATESGVIEYIIDNGGTYSAGTLNNPTNSSSPEVTVGNNTSTDYGNNGFYTVIETNDTQSATYKGSYNYPDAINETIASCIQVCYFPGVNGEPLPSINGITTLSPNNKASGIWENMPSNAFIVLESKEKGFVITRMPNPETSITGEDAVEGMLVYDTDDNCLKMYDGTSWFCLQQGCPLTGSAKNTNK